MHPVTVFFDRMRIDDYTPGKPYRWAHLKRDGYCICAFKHRGELSVYTRTPCRYWSGQQWYRDLQERLPDDFWIAGELFVQGGTSSDVRSVLAERPTKTGTFEVFYSPNVGSFEELNARCGQMGLATIEFAKDVTSIPAGYEGFVFKNGYHPVGPYTWMKYKPNPTMDLRIVGMERSYQGKHAGKLGAFICESDDRKIKTRVGVMTDDVRNNATENFELWRGKIIEVEFQMVTEKGSLRHPRFIRIRDDKSTTERAKNV